MSARRKDPCVDVNPALPLASVVTPVSCWSSLKKKPAGAATPLSEVARGSKPPLEKEHAPGVGVGPGVGVAVGTTVGVGVGATAPQQDLELTATVSTRHPVPATLASDAIRNRSRIGCPAAAAGRLTVVVTKAACVPVHACRPAIGLENEVLIGPV